MPPASRPLRDGDGWTQRSRAEFAEILGTDDAPPTEAATATRLAHEWLIAEPPQIVEVRAGRQVGDGLLSKVEGRVAQLRLLDDFIGVNDLNDLVRRELDVTVGLLAYAVYDDTLGRRRRSRSCASSPDGSPATPACICPRSGTTSPE